MTENCGSGDILPGDFIIDALALTSTRDSCRLSAVSSTFRSAAESDPLWEKFLPSDYQEILTRAVTPVVYTSKKELYFRLCDSIFIDDGHVSFSLERSTGRRCYMLGPRGLWIPWVEDLRYWRYVSQPDSRFLEVAELLDVCWLEMVGGLKNVILSPRTTYAAYFIFKLNEDSYGLDFPAQETLFKAGDHISEHSVFLQPPPILEEMDQEAPPRVPRWRDDGWMEIEMGDFFNDEEIGVDVHLSFKHTKVMNWKRGLIFQGFDIRPKN